MRLRRTDIAGPDIHAILLDVSPHGFRARHDCGTLSSGQTVLFDHSAGTGKARVVWTRIAEGGVESGFYVFPT